MYILASHLTVTRVCYLCTDFGSLLLHVEHGFCRCVYFLNRRTFIFNIMFMQEQWTGKTRLIHLK